MSGWFSDPMTIDGWAVSWNQHQRGIGIPSEDVTQFRVFLRGCVKLLPDVMALTEKLRAEVTGSRQNLGEMEEAPHPAIRLYGTTFRGNHQYCLEVMWDGAVFLFRLAGDKPDPDPFVGSLDYVGK